MIDEFCVQERLFPQETKRSSMSLVNVPSVIFSQSHRQSLSSVGSIQIDFDEHVPPELQDEFAQYGAEVSSLIEKTKLSLEQLIGLDSRVRAALFKNTKLFIYYLDIGVLDLNPLLIMEPAKAAQIINYLSLDAVNIAKAAKIPLSELLSIKESILVQLIENHAYTMVLLNSSYTTFNELKIIPEANLHEFFQNWKQIILLLSKEHDLKKTQHMTLGTFSRTYHLIRTEIYSSFSRVLQLNDLGISTVQIIALEPYDRYILLAKDKSGTSQYNAIYDRLQKEAAQEAALVEPLARKKRTCTIS